MSSPRSRDRRTCKRARALLGALLAGLALAAQLASAEDEPPQPSAEPAAAPAEPDAAAEPEPGEAKPAAPDAQANVPPNIEVIYVEGSAYEGVGAEVASSVTQFDAEALQAIGAQNIGDLAKVTPNLEIKTAGATAPTFFIRGVGLSDFAANAAGAVAIYQGDVPMNAPALQLGSLFDLETVSVLRGPQGSGSNRNASAGAIRIIPRKPSGELGAWLRSTLGNYALHDFEGGIEAPLLEEMLSGRLSFRFTERDPLASNRCDEVPSRPPGTNTPIPPAFIGQPVPPLFERAASPATAQFWRSVSFCGEARFAQFANPDPPPSQYGPFGAGRQISPLPGGLEGDVNDLHNWAARGLFSFQPPEIDMNWLVNVHGSHRNELSTLGQAVGTFQSIYGNSVAQSGAYIGRDVVEMRDELARELDPDNSQTPAEIAEINRELGRRLARNGDKHPFRGDYNRVGDTVLDTFGASLKGEWAFPDVTLTSVTGYDTYNRYRDTDQDFTPERLFEATQRDDAWQIYQELRASGELPDSYVRWDVGGYYLGEDLQTSTIQLARAITLNFPETLFLDYTQDLYSWGAFGGFSWDFLDDFTLEGGVRWNWEQKKFDYLLTTASSPDVESVVQENEIWQAPTGMLSLTYRFREDTSVYWKYSRGWKGGHFNALPQTTLGATVAEPETIDSFEVGLNGLWFDGKIGINTQMFYYAYQDYQVLVVQDNAAGPPGIAIINANDAQVYGAEVDARIEPIESLVATVRIGWLESEFLDFTNQVTRTVIGTDGNATTRIVTVDYTGNQLINSPKLKASGALEYTLELGRYGALIPRYDFAWTDDIYFDPTEGRGSPNAQNQVFLPKYATGQKAYWLHNVRLGYRTADGSLEIGGWVRNLTDQVYKTYGFDASSFARVVINYVGEPRTYGMDFTVNF